MTDPIDAPSYLVVTGVVGLTLLIIAALAGVMKTARYFNPPKAPPSRNIDLEPHEYRSKGPGRWREPIFGPNAKPFALQFVVGLIIWAVVSWAAYTYVEEPFERLFCAYITGSCS